MNERFIREIGLFGEEGVSKLKAAKVVVIGCGGVGSYAVEALARAGIGALTVIDGDTVSESNINRQLIALGSTVGQNKAELEKARILDINPDCAVTAVCEFITPGNCASLIGVPDFVIDACDDTEAKLALISYCTSLSIPVVSSMGTGNRLDPTKFEITDISKTEGDPLARSIRKKLREMGINHLPVLFSREIPAVRAVPPASVSFVPPVAGMILGGYVIRKIAGV